MSEQTSNTDLRAALARALAKLEQLEEENYYLKLRVEGYREAMREMRETEFCHECRCAKFGSR